MTGDDTHTPDASNPNGNCTPSPEVCNDGIDNDCDGRADCGAAEPGDLSHIVASTDR